jgi:asparagine synthase (glutamine-hydrolysing)
LIKAIIQTATITKTEILKRENMCGFAGVLNRTKLLDARLLQEHAKKVSFRGPDATSISIFDHNLEKSTQGTSALFFNRLAIIDLDPRSNQPFENERYSLVFNGEIYNFLSLKNRLIAENYSFKTTSDTEVLFNALIKYGSAALPMLNGMFAFFFLDRKTGKFILARDRTGIKTLYYKQEGDSLLFASEIDSIIRLSSTKNTIRSESILEYLALQYIPTPFSIYDGINKLPPGTSISYSVNFLHEKQKLEYEVYWDANNNFRQGNFDGAPNLENCLTQSLNSHLVSDVPLGIFLSSGVDSSLLAALINKHFSQSRRFDFFTIKFEEPNQNDESNEAKQFLDGFNNPNFFHHTLLISENSLVKAWENIFNFTDEPFGDNALVLNAEIARKAREKVTVALSGDGGDELFYGYPRYQYFHDYYHRNPIGKLKKIFMNMTPLIPLEPFKNLIRALLHRGVLTRYLKSVSSKFLGYSDIHRNPDLWWKNGIEPFLDRDDLPSILDFKSYLPDCMFYKVDRSSMGVSLEVRVPYLDNNVIDLAMGLSLDDKMTLEFGLKTPLKRILQQLAPHYNITQPKKGFSFPLAKWMKGRFKNQIEEYLISSEISWIGIEPRFIRKLVIDYFAGRNDNTYEIWYLFNLMHWYFTKKSSGLI